jgi:CHU_C Type IX secretion signal domain
LKKLFILISIYFISHNLFAQIYAPEADFADTTKYVNDSILGLDSIFVYYSPGYNGFPITASLQASLNGTSGLTFNWKIYDESIPGFIDVMNPNLVYNDDSSLCTIDQLESGGYFVEITKEDIIDTSFTAWVFVNYMKVDIEVESNCTFTQLSGIEGGNMFYYFDLLDNTRIELPNGLNIEWTAEPEVEATLRPYESVYLNPPHYEDTEFSVVVRDSFNYEKEDQKHVLAIATKANFYAIEGVEVITDTVVKEKEAPYHVQFVDSSKNAYSYEWKFYNDLEKTWTGKDTLLGLTTLNPPILLDIDPDSIVYYRPGNYDVTLTVAGPAYEIDGDIFFCIDSLYKDDYINVDTSSIKNPLPNVFTPNGSNPIFKIKEGGGESSFSTRSLRSFHISIYNRWGKKVYDYADSTGAWEGWNGEIKGEGRLVEPGVYYYVLTAKGWDGRPWEFKSFVHVFYSK